MKSLIAPFLDTTSVNNDISLISLALDKYPSHVIDCFPWAAYKSDVTIDFSIAYTSTNLVLKFRVREKHIRAINTGINSPVYEDSCVEFFVSFDETGYYNFEFNCIGSKLAEFGKNRKGRQFLPSGAIEKINTETVIKRSSDDFFLWHLTIAIPFETFIHHQIKDLRNQKCRANFYKCGDKLPEPHYMVWSPVHTTEPDFHQPSHFGELIFSDVGLTQ